MNLGSIDLSQLDVLRPILPFPLWQKVAVLAGGFVLLVGLYMYMNWMPLYEEIEQAQTNVDDRRHMLEKNRRLATNLPRKQEEYAQLEKQLNVALKMLPEKSQIPDLLEGVSRAGTESGLFFRVFRPVSEVPKQFYAEVPVEVEISGTYRQLMTFLNRVGEMPRIVDVKSLKIDLDNQAVAEGRAPAGQLPLDISGLAVTYRFVESAEAGKAGKDDKKGGRKGR